MGLQDFIITPLYFFLLLLGAYLIRPVVTTPDTRPHFIPALLVRFLGAVTLGIIYQFYYGGGDTLSFHTHGSRWIWEAFWHDFDKGIQLLLENGGRHRMPETFEYSQYIWYYRDPKSFFVVRLTALIDLLTYHTYSATALFYAVFSFSGAWALYSALRRLYPHVKYLHWGILFIPSTIFWGSGILKDTVTLSALSWMASSLVHIIKFRRLHLKYWVVIGLSAWLIYAIKPYILLSFLPITLVWLYFENLSKIKNTLLKALTAPILFLVFGFSAYGLVLVAASESYHLDNIAQKAAITAYDIRYGWGARTQGTGGYDLGALDGTWDSMLQRMPQAINVTFFRPYLWEVRNPLMFLSALEALIAFVLTLRVVISGRWRIIPSDAFLIFCLVFSLVFAFGVGISTYNFGTLARYKIPLIPFYATLLAVCHPASRIEHGA